MKQAGADSSRPGERRQATVVFSDISGFTAISEKLDPEEVTSLMNDCFHELGTIIEHYGGTIDKFIGDCMMAVFGVPAALENAPEKAVLAARDIRAKLYELNVEQRLDPPLDIHIGVNSGEVIYGEVGSASTRDYTVMGDTVNVASRLEEISDPGKILVGYETYRYTNHILAYRECPAVSVKGKSKKVPIFEFIAPIAAGADQRSTSRHNVTSRIVGRDRELNELELRVIKAQNGDGSVVSVVGEAGVGKSRLLDEIKNRESTKKLLCLEGKALSYGRTLNFYPLISALQNWAGISDTDGEEAAIEKLRAALNAAIGDRAAEVFPFVASFMSLRPSNDDSERLARMDRETLSKLIANNVRGLFAEIADARPLLVLLEDLHWADTSTIEMILDGRPIEALKYAPRAPSALPNTMPLLHMIRHSFSVTHRPCSIGSLYCWMI